MRVAWERLQLAELALPTPKPQATDILERLPDDFNLEAAQNKYPVIYEESMNTVFCQELGRANVLLQVIRASMQDLKKAVRGLILMSEAMDVVGQALFNGKVPAMWLKRSFPSLKPLGPYVKEVIERCEFFQEWLNQGPPTVYWLSGFFFTQVDRPSSPSHQPNWTHIQLSLTVDVHAGVSHRSKAEFCKKIQDPH